MKKFSFHVGACGMYSMEFYARTLSDAKAQCRRFLGVKRLPNHTSIWWK